MDRSIVVANRAVQPKRIPAKTTKGKASTAKTQYTPPQTVWYGMCKKLRNNVLDVMRSFLGKHGKYTNIVKNSIDAYNRGFYSSSAIEDYKQNDKKRKYPIIADSEQMACHTKFAFYRFSEPMELLADFIHDMVCYSTTNPAISVTLNEIVYQDELAETVVIRGTYVDVDTDEQRDVVVKYMSNNSRIIEEIDFYNKVAAISKDSLPWCDTSMELWGEPILVVKNMQKLDTTDNPYAVGVDILKILKNIHSKIVHSDIKPSNIMKEMDDTGRWTYKLIDYGGSSSDKVGDFFKRYALTKWFANTDQYKDVVGDREKLRTSPKNELLELLHSLRYMQLVIDKPKKRSAAYKGCKGGFERRLAKYYDYLMELPETPSCEDYDALISILSSKKSHKNRDASSSRQ